MQNLTTLTDEQIVEIARSQSSKIEDQDKNAEAFGELVTRYQAKLNRYATYLTKDTAIGEDVVQNSFIKAYQNLQSFNTKKKFSSWIYRIVHNEAINKVKRESRLINIDGFAEIFEGKTKIEEDYEKEEAAQILKQNLDKIGLKYKEVLVLYYLEDQSYEEISTILKMPMGTVATRMNRAKKKLREIYEKEGEN